jgi:hypothetical protein
MTPSPTNARKRSSHEVTIRSVVDFAREVRIHMNDERVIFGSVMSPAGHAVTFFHIRPWGVADSMAIEFDDVALASPVKQMGWDRHRAIAAEQRAGSFANGRKTTKK